MLQGNLADIFECFGLRFKHEGKSRLVGLEAKNRVNSIVNSRNEKVIEEYRVKFKLLIDEGIITRADLERYFLKDVDALRKGGIKEDEFIATLNNHLLDIIVTVREPSKRLDLVRSFGLT